ESSQTPGETQISNGPILPKNALMQLNEIKPGLQYKLLSQSGPVHAPVFLMAVEVNGQTFEGSGPTKKKAKLHVAEKAHLAMDPKLIQSRLGKCVNKMLEYHCSSGLNVFF
uniref:Adenosine deaminase RNA specific B1b n=1 Tax=Callorhinchus milii TaxID=7868 RepID=A0A4W3HRH0_CALMI